jgi:uncharacterized phage protein (TIGR01671 family)
MRPDNLKLRIWDIQNKRFCPIHVDAYKITWHGDFWSISCSKHYDATCFPFHNLKSKRFVIQQYTGLKDSNGKEIYEGDIIISNQDVGSFEVTWDEDSVSFLVGGDLWPNAKIKIIGNIFENSELLLK